VAVDDSATRDLRRLLRIAWVQLGSISRVFGSIHVDLTVFLFLFCPSNLI
jgi:hypothetical protein